VEADGLRIQGVSTEIGTFDITVTAKDADGGVASLPVKITVNPSLEGEVSAGGTHSCAITPTGGAKCWGNNANGQLGDGTTNSSSVPVNVVGLTSGITAISTGDTFTCAVTTSGGVKCWGFNGNGELGNNSTTNSPVPVDVSGLTSGVASVSAGYVHACAVTTTGAAKCWGDNINGQLGNASNTDSLVPVQVSGLASGVASISSGVRHSCVVNTAGGVKCWGLNTYGALGNNTNTTSNAPVQVSGLTSGVTSVSGGYRHTCATTTSGKVKCWGFNNVGQLGDNSKTDRTSPVDVANLSNVLQIGLSEGHVCAVTATGGAFCWGYNINGQLGDNSTTDRSVPTQVSGLASGVTSVTAGFRHSCASMANGSTKCWGLGTNGRLGNGGTTQSNVPVNVSG
jgi:alpha-tubulin suppressor-like RCC1 family protein